ncbi:ABC transporter substrate-binding protein [Clostridium sartagoforme AAU1]|jgi:iron(III) transport system substrate-binding protein|uniref:ABC transporter substrate-binding protein n=1 Tax=Clostridium sartagoforme AAU1 TaxID=1202534 RepID=R9C9F2_9CLOT|nr:ABC transporter substrate-binding protein [Clostridium sartagoforme]EOR25883.1 ABC transporter substrate-binding protein [Clostridium sartagoforme AAU1]
MKKVLATVICASMMLGMVSCGGKTEGADVKKEETASKNLVVYCPHPLEFIDPIVAEFESETGVQVDVVAAGTGELLKRIESEKDNPLGDVMWGGSLGTLEPKVDFFEAYTSANEADLMDDCKNTDGKITRFSVIPSVLMINTNLIGDIKVTGYEDLLKPELKGKIAHADPAKSSSSFEHLVNMLYAMGNGTPENGWDYADKLAGNLDGKLLSGSSAVYKGVADGEYTVGLTFEEGGAKYVKDGSPVEIVYMKEGVISKPDGVAIIKGAKNMDNAKKFIDFLTSKETQTMVASELSRRSVRKDVDPAEGLKAIKDINIIQDDADVVKDNKQAWIDKFKEIFTNK